MKTIFKIIVALVVFVGCFNVGRALLYEYQFEDRIHDALLFDPRMTDKEIVQMVMENAAEYEIPIQPDDITIRAVNQDVHVDMSYTMDVTIIPGVFSREWTFTPSTSTRMLVGNRRKPS